MSKKGLKTPLRYPGGKSRAVTKMAQYFPNLRDYTEYREPFLGGGSVAIYVSQMYPHLKITVNDLYEPLMNFWSNLQMFGDELYTELKSIKTTYCNQDSARCLFSEMKDVVNAIKRRQKFRPFAPVVLAEHAEKYFEMPKYNRCEYMQLAVRCKLPEEIPAVVHKDGTSRVQVVGKESNNEQMREILYHWWLLTGCPVLLNTSLNIKGQPMINDHEDIKILESNNPSLKVFNG